MLITPSDICITCEESAANDVTHTVLICPALENARRDARIHKHTSVESVVEKMQSNNMTCSTDLLEERVREFSGQSAAAAGVPRYLSASKSMLMNEV